ncbi:MAG: PIN domain-containing protein [Candidatus Cloacimonetes bacterium]|nr:PIN domain-containing protein [Candidatus Cloacimonadota bacterium]
MNGNRFLLDTNCIINLLNGTSKDLILNLEKAEWIGISIISQLEFLSFPDLSESDRILFKRFSECITVIGLAENNSELLNQVINIRIQKNLKLPDCIILATAKYTNSILLTQDKKLLSSNDENVIAIDY